MAQSRTIWTAPAVSLTGLTGATAATRLVGGTVSGAPLSGTFAVGDCTIDQSGKVWIYTSGGWKQTGGDGAFETTITGNGSTTSFVITPTITPVATGVWNVSVVNQSTGALEYPDVTINQTTSAITIAFVIPPVTGLVYSVLVAGGATSPTGTPFPSPDAQSIGARAVTCDPQLPYLQHTPGNSEHHCSRVWLPAGEVVSRIGCLMWTAGASLTHGNFGLWKYSGSGATFTLIASTPDNPTLFQSLPSSVAGWVSDTLATPYTIPTSGIYWLGGCVTGTTLPSFHSIGVNGTAAGGRSRPFLMNPNSAAWPFFGETSVSGVCENQTLTGITDYSSWPHVFACA